MIAAIKQKLRRAGIENPDLHLRIILREVGGFSDVDILLNRLPETLSRTVLDAFERLERGEPLSRILGYREFYGRRFYLNDGTLDPRPDSETLIDAVLTWVKKNNAKDVKVLDLGTGTGCLLLTLLAEIEEARGVGVDLSADAISMAQRNSRALKLESRSVFQTGNWFEGITDQFDVIISNPPYIRTDVIANLESSVKNHDPLLALDGGTDGLTAYKNLLSNLKNHLAEGGRAFFEIGFDQADDLARLVGAYGANLIHTHRDLGGHPRVVEIAYGDK